MANAVMAIACGYPDTNDAARLSSDPVHKLLVGRDGSQSQPSIGSAQQDRPAVGTALSLIKLGHDRVSPVPTADSWAGRWGPAVCAVLAGSAGFQVSDPNQASADRYVVGYDFLDLTFYFSFAGVAGELLQSYSA
jgi:hypothetical protein